MTGQKVKLTAREKSELIIEGIVTVMIMILLNFAVLVLFTQMVGRSQQVQDGIWLLKIGLNQNNNLQLWSWQWVFVVFMAIFDAIIVWWRLIRRYHQIQMRHVIVELHYIAEGHLGHRIPFVVKTDLQKVIDSINALVDFTVQSMEEERQIEKSKDELISNVSHDIRTPLTSIIGYLGLIEDKQYRSEDELLKYSHTAYVKSKQMKVLVDDLFEYTKVRQTGTHLNTSEFSLTNLLEQLAASFELEAEKKNVEITVTTKPDPLIMTADPEKLVRVFNNLLVNGLKYGKGATHIWLTAEALGQEIIIKVANDGQEIPNDSLSHLFDRFYRVEESRSQETGGSGLGLAIAQSIVALHGGYIYATSDAKMTSFVMYLPMAPGKKVEKPAVIAQQEEQHKENRKGSTHVSA
ncbi:MAG: HAMP domain-containing sensor histidine kinase [Schleiferilactobacillus perolens]|jgi:signal transduction histidine kinase|uniref:sensor histidine kinase n=1 Tax=Schleiferilactobacillus perolens TaxID=100468 RepID=UPI0039EA34BF